ncbi:MAG: CHAT domain-containing protein [Blastocatellia bacterium]
MKNVIRVIASAWIGLLCIATFAKAQPDAPLITPGTTIERELAAGQSHTFSLSLEAGQFVFMTVTELGLDLFVELQQPGQQKALGLNYSRNMFGMERVLWVAKVSGVWSLTIKAPAPAPPTTGRYVLKFIESRPATELDQTCVSAERSFEQGAKLISQNASKQQLQTARTYLQTAVDGYRVSSDQWGEMNALRRMGMAWQLVDWKQARETWAIALPLAVTLNDQFTEARLLLGIGHSFLIPGDLIEAKSWMERAVTLSRQIGDEETEFAARISSSAMYGQFGYLQQGVEHSLRALTLTRTLGNKNSEASTLNNLSIVMRQLGEYQQALGYAEQSLALFRAEKDLVGEAGILTNLGSIYRSMEQYPQAIEQYQQALEMARRLGTVEQQARALSLIASIQYRTGNYQQVLIYADQAMTLRKKLNDRGGQAATAYQLGRAYYKLGDSSRALEQLNFALSIQRQTQSRLAESDTALMLATIERDQGNLAKALSLIETTLQINDSIRNQITSPELRATFAAAEREKEEFYLDLLLRLHERQPTAGYDRAALQASENRRARVLRELLRESQADIRQGVDVELLERETVLRLALDNAANRLTRLLGNQTNETQLAESRKQFDQATTAFQQIQSVIRQNSPRYAALTQPSALNLTEIQKLLGADTTLLEYALGKERSVLWVVTADSALTITLPAQNQIEAVASKCYDLLKISQQRRWQRAAESSTTELSRLILPSSPELLKLLNRKRLVIVADGALQYIPFGVLPMPATPNTRLNSRFEVVNLPSVSTLATLRSERSTHTSPHPSAEKPLAVFADPVFSENDPRVKTVVAQKALTTITPNFSLHSDQLTRSAKDIGVQTFARLPYSRQEAEAILALTGDNQNLKAFDFAANRAMLLNANLSQYRIIHFATHGVINSRHPEQSGITLSLVNETGQPQDGFLRMTDLYNLKLNADLVVLSACRTAMGKDMKGEGLIGLTRGFMYAGTPRVIASLWDVNDAATAELMRRFYRYLLKDKLSAAAALRAAQLSLAKDARWAAPYYWSGFVIQGDWQENK